MKVLVLFAHPALERSRVNRELIQAARACAGVTFHDLYETYPDLHIDIEREQELLLAHDVYVFQHPFFWYSTPALLKEWQDLVLEHNWAYGHDGRQLRGKITLNVLTAGGPQHAYQAGGFNRFTVRQLLAPWEATAALCGMRFLAPFVVFGALRLAGADVAPHRTRYRHLLQALVDDRLDLERAAAVSQLNDTLDDLIRAPGDPAAGQPPGGERATPSETS